MMKKIRLVIIGILLVVTSGCFPIFVPADGDHRGHEEHDRGDHRDHDHGEHGDHH
jgi:hypothetical protein